jgi:hypothetical protein
MQTTEEEMIRKTVFGAGISDLHLGDRDDTVSRPTTASARRSVIWSRERRLYEDASRQRLAEFSHHGYMQYQYPELGKHYPGTWRVADGEEVKRIVERLTRPTAISSIRAKSAPVLHRRVRTTATQQTLTSQ